MRIRRIPLRVGDNDNRSPLAIQFAQQLHHFHAIYRIQISGRFVSQQQLTVRHYRTGDGHTLLLSALQLLRIMVGTM